MTELKVHARECDTELMVQSDELRAAFTSRLKKALAHANIPSRGAGTLLAKAAGKTPKAASKWLNAESMPGRDSIVAIANALNVRTEWLLYGWGAITSEQGVVLVGDFARNRPDTIDIPRLEIAGSMGNGKAQPSEHIDVIERMSVSTEWLKRNVRSTSLNKLAIITGYGDSMEGTFNDGDLLLVDRGITEIKIDAVYVLALEEELYIKRLQRRPDGVLLMLSDNPKYAPYEITPDKMGMFQVLGRVLLAWNARKL